MGLTPFDRNPPRPWLAALLSVVASGLGHAYAGVPRTGAAWWIAARVVVLAALAIASRVSGVAPMIFVAGLIVAIPVVVGTDAWRVARGAGRAPVVDRGNRTIRTIAFFVVASLAGLGLRMAANRYIAEAYRIPSSAMEPTIVSGDWLYVVSADARSVHPGALVVYMQGGTPLLKRVVAVPGDTIEMRQGRLLRNDRVVVEPYVENDWRPDYADDAFGWQANFIADPSRRRIYRPTRDTWGPLVIPAQRFFVLGDNRHNSDDSRYTGLIALTDVVGRPTEIYFSWSSDSSAVRWKRIGVEVR